jgi:integrase
MASISFLLQSTSNPAPIYIRIIDGRLVDFKTKTNFIINPKDWNKTRKRPKNLQNANLKNLNVELENLKVKVINFYNQRKNEDIDLDWLKKIINPNQSSIPKKLVDYFDFYLDERKQELNLRTVKKIKVVQNKLKKMKSTVSIKDVGVRFRNDFTKWNLENGYAENTILANLKEIKAMCFHARKRGLEISNELDEIKVTQKKAQSIYLTFQEIDKICETDYKESHLNDARDWLLISCYTGQRVSDFMRFDKKMIRKQGGRSLIEFTQTKTGKIMTIPLHDKILEILEKREGNFPRKQFDQKYNYNLKIIGKKAGLNQIVWGGINVNNRKVFGNYKKYELLTSHIGRRSFATNYYGTIPTPLLMSATGHGSEKTFLIYVGKSSADNAMRLADFF